MGDLTAGLAGLYSEDELVSIEAHRSIVNIMTFGLIGFESWEDNKTHPRNIPRDAVRALNNLKESMNQSLDAFEEYEEAAPGHFMGGVPLQAAIRQMHVDIIRALNTVGIETWGEAAKEHLVNRGVWDKALAERLAQRLGLSEHCFPFGTPVHLPNSTTAPIETLSVGDEVLAFTDGASELTPARVVRLYENVTQEMIRLEFADGRDVLHVTLGHAFLDEIGGFTKISDLLKLGGACARVIDADGSVIKVTDRWLQYPAEAA